MQKIINLKSFSENIFTIKARKKYFEATDLRSTLNFQKIQNPFRNYVARKHFIRMDSLVVLKPGTNNTLAMSQDEKFGDNA